MCHSVAVARQRVQLQFPRCVYFLNSVNSIQNPAALKRLVQVPLIIDHTYLKGIGAKWHMNWLVYFHGWHIPIRRGCSKGKTAEQGSTSLREILQLGARCLQNSYFNKKNTPETQKYREGSPIDVCQIAQKTIGRSFSFRIIILNYFAHCFQSPARQ